VANNVENLIHKITWEGPLEEYRGCGFPPEILVFFIYFSKILSVFHVYIAVHGSLFEMVHPFRSPCFLIYFPNIFSVF